MKISGQLSPDHISDKLKPYTIQVPDAGSCIVKSASKLIPLPQCFEHLTPHRNAVHGLTPAGIEEFSLNSLRLILASWRAYGRVNDKKAVSVRFTQASHACICDGARVWRCRAALRNSPG